MLLACLIPGNLVLTLGPDSCLLTLVLATVLASHVLVMDSTDVLQGDSCLVILIREMDTQGWGLCGVWMK